MKGAFVPPVEVIVVASVLGALCLAILPTCLYLYVEPRGRAHWARPGDSPADRTAPLLVRTAAWLSFVVAELAVPWGIVPATCGVLLYLQAKLGIARPFGFFVTAAVFILAVAQVIAAVRLLPLGVHLLVRDPRVGSRAGALARTNAVLSAFVLAAGAGLARVMADVPGLVHPWLRTALEWSALWPLEAYAALCLLHALVLWPCARACAEAQ
jgi:hypothetical protein